MPNWFVHVKWTEKAGIPKKIAEFVNRSIDYGSNWVINEEHGRELEDEGPFYQQLVYFYDKDKGRKYYVRACLLHHLLDFFKETNIDSHDIELVFESFLKKKAVIKITDLEGNKVDFNSELKEIFHLLRENKEKLLNDLFGF